MNESEKERLIKKDIESIENKVRHAFNQGYEMGMKESSSEIPNTCGDAISRAELLKAIDTWDKFGYAPTNELIPLRSNVDKDKYVPYIHYDDVIKCIKNMPSITPQHSDVEIQKIQEMEQAEIQKAYELGKAEMHPCEDAISRQAALNAITMAEVRRQAVDSVNKLPSVSPQQRTGRQIQKEEEGDAEPFIIWRCSECHGYQRKPTTYCPNCGARMNS